MNRARFTGLPRSSGLGSALVPDGSWSYAWVCLRWALARDDRPWGGTSPPGVVVTYAPGRGGLYAELTLQGFCGIPQFDGYAGYTHLIAADRIGPGKRPETSRTTYPRTVICCTASRINSSL